MCMAIKDRIGGIVAGGAIAVLLGTYVSFYVRQHYIKNNLEPGAIHCPLRSNISIHIGTNLPTLKNVDVDDNGLYESVLIYNNKQGEKFYQVATQSLEGITLSSPQKL